MSIQFFTHIYRLHALPMHLWLILLPLPQVIFLPKPLVYTSFLYSFSTFLVQTALVNFPCYDFVMEMASEIKNEGVFFCNWGWFKALSGKLGAKIVETTRKIKKLGQDDPRRIIHSLKFGLALTLVSLIYYFEPLYKGFGNSAMWAILTVIVVFEFSVG